MPTRYLRTILILLLCAVVGSPAPAPNQVTFSIVSYMYQWGPPLGLTEGSPGTFYSFGGVAQQAAFSITTAGTKTILATFPTSTYIQAPLVSAANQRFYSSTQKSRNPPDVFSVSSTRGKDVYASQTVVPALTQNLPNGSMLGVGVALSNNLPYLISTDLMGGVTTIYTFPSGQFLSHTALLATDGNYYGVAYLQDASGYVYRVTPSGALTQLVTFPPPAFHGGAHFVPLLQATDGNLYGAIPGGGANGTGIVYKLTLAGQYTLLYTFPAGKDYNPMALIQASDGNLYGATLGQNGRSLLFEITPSGQYTQLYQMAGIGCQCLLTQGSDGIIYGTALVGGPVGAGAVFALNAGLSKPAPRAQQFYPTSGSVGTSVRIWGQNLLSASVQFNGVPATAVTNSGANYVFATVPAGATTGPITVTTPGGSSTTKASFTVN